MKKLIRILVCIWLIVTFLPLVDTTNVDKTRDLPNIGQPGWPIHIYGPELEIGNITNGICAIIKNIGDADAINVEWKISLEGRIIISPSDRCEEGIIELLEAGSEETVCWKIGLLLGLGRARIKVTASALNANTATKTVNVFLLGPFVLGLPE